LKMNVSTRRTSDNELQRLESLHAATDNEVHRARENP